MTLVPTILDTDVLSAVMAEHRAPSLVQRVNDYLAAYGRLTFSVITQFELLRGFHARRASRKIAAFERLCAQSELLPLTHRIIVRASELYGDLHRSGSLIADADLLIAATALEHGLVLATNNEKHFSRVPSLVIDNWLK